MFCGAFILHIGFSQIFYKYNKYYICEIFINYLSKMASDRCVLARRYEERARTTALSERQAGQKTRSLSAWQEWLQRRGRSGLWKAWGRAVTLWPLPDLVEAATLWPERFLVSCAGPLQKVALQFMYDFQRSPNMAVGFIHGNLCPPTCMWDGI